MSEIEFESDSHGTHSLGAQTVHVAEPRGLGAWMVKHGLSKTPEAAKKIMVAVTIINFCIIIFIFIKFIL